MSRLLLQDEADFVIVGTGAGGATAARVLAAAGHSVLLLEEGPNLVLRRRPLELLPAMRDTFRDFGTQLAKGPAPFPLLQGRLVGGSTAINSGIIWRMPEAVRREWAESWGLGELVEERGLTEAFETIEKETGVEETAEEVMGGNALLLREGARALGHQGLVTLRNAPGCNGAGRCLQGCPSGSKQSMDRSYVPRALEDGARLHALARVRRVRIEGGRAVGVEGDVLDPESRRPRGRLSVRARRAVIVAGGAVQTPLVLRRSGLKGLVGERFQTHPGSAIVGRFPEPVGMGFGATQSYQVPVFDQGFKIESLSLPAEMIAARIPGAGNEWQTRLADLGSYGQWAVLARGEALGRVRPGWDGADVRYVPTARDFEKLRRGIALAARMMFAAGATEVYPWIASRPTILRDPSEVRLLEEGEVVPKDFHMMASHLFGSAAAGADPARSVVGPDLQHHEVKGLYVMDASVFPTTLGVNPQHSIMGVVWRAAERLAAREGAAAAA